MLGIKVSIIICTCNRAEHLRLTLASMAGVCVPETIPTELIVIDNGSTDNTAEVIQQCQLPNMPVRYVRELRRGQCYARNTGMAEAQGEVFLWTDDDVRPSKNWITGMCGPILRGEADAIVGGVKLAPHLERPWMESLHRSWLASTHDLNAKNPESIVGANMAFSRRVLERVPGFDTELGPGALGFFDETLFSWQLKEAGYSVAASFDVCVEHHLDASRLTRRSFLASAKKMGNSDAYTIYHWKHNESHSLYLLLMKRYLRLFYWRITRWQDLLSNKGMPVWEMEVTTHIHCYNYLLKEKNKPRHYQKHGLIKIKANTTL